MSRPLDSIPIDLAGAAVVVTGATAGIGKAAAWALARLGAQVTLVGRSEPKVAAVADELAARGVPRDRFALGVADLSRGGEVKALADQLARKHARLDALVNNAGCYPAARVITPEGHEEAWATNVLAYEILTTRLLPSVKAARGRVVYVASTLAGDLDPDDLDFTRRAFGGVTAYKQSKQANRMLAWAWTRRLAGRGATINVAHPGGVATNLAHRQTGIYGWISRLAFAAQRTPERGADTPVWLAASPELAGASGGFYKDRRRLSCRWQADVAGQDALWQQVQEQIA